MTSSTYGRETSWRDNRQAHMQYGWEHSACLLACLFLISPLSSLFRLGACCLLLEVDLQKESLFMKTIEMKWWVVFQKASNPELTFKKQTTTSIGTAHMVSRSFSCHSSILYQQLTRHLAREMLIGSLFSMSILFQKWIAHKTQLQLHRHCRRGSI